jgi:hypothetical protein
MSSYRLTGTIEIIVDRSTIQCNTAERKSTTIDSLPRKQSKTFMSEAVLTPFQRPESIVDYLEVAGRRILVLSNLGVWLQDRLFL